MVFKLFLFCSGNIFYSVLFLILFLFFFFFPESIDILGINYLYGIDVIVVLGFSLLVLLSMIYIGGQVSKLKRYRSIDVYQIVVLNQVMLKGERRKKEFFLNVLGKKKKILFSDTEQKTEVGEESFNFRQ